MISEKYLRDCLRTQHKKFRQSRFMINEEIWVLKAVSMSFLLPEMITDCKRDQQ